MKTTINKLDDCKVELTVEVEGEMWQKALSSGKRKLLSNVSIKGFRKGHVPERLVNLPAERIAEEAIREVLNPAFNEALRSTGLRPYDQAVPEVKELKEEGPVLVYRFTHGPVVELGKYEGLTADHPVASVTEEEISADINARLERSADLVSVERESKLGDTVIIDFVGYVDGVAFDGGSAENYELVLGSNSFVPGFEDAIVGLKPGEERDIEITFPEQYVAELAGKPATFHVALHEVKEKVVNALSDEAVLDMNIRDVKTVDELKEFVRKDLLQKKVNQIEQRYLDSILDQIVASSKIEYPSEILNKETDASIARNKAQIEDNGLSFEQFLQISGISEEEYRNRQKEESARNLARFFVTDKLCAENKLSPTREEVLAEVDRLAGNYNMKRNDVIKAFNNDLSSIADQLRSSRLTRFLLEKNPHVEAPAKEEKAEETKKAAKKEAKAEEKEESPAKKPAAKKAPAKKPAKPKEEKPAE